MIQISIYKRASDIKSKDITDLSILLDNIRDGRWQDQILKLRNTTDPKLQDELKKKLPGVTLSGQFSQRKDEHLFKHSGFIGIDIDKYDPNELKELLATDPHVYSIFTSCRGHGACVILRITPSKHKLAFHSIGAYLLKEYGIVMDSTSVNVSRLRFVSYDPHIYINEGALKFTDFLPPQKKLKTKKIIFVQSDFEAIIQQLQSNNLDITYDYRDWLKVGFGIADKFGDAGRHYFHLISEISSKYDHKICERQYSSCLNAKGGMTHATIASFYWLAKQAGCKMYSTETKEVIKIASTHKRSGLNNESSLEAFTEFGDHDIDLVKEVISQVDDKTIPDEISMVETIESDLRFNWSIRRNVITRNLEIKKGTRHERMETKHFNSIYLKLKKVHEKLSYDLVDRIILSEETPEYNPLIQFFQDNIKIKSYGHIQDLSNTITGEYGLLGDDRCYFIKKWLIGLVSAAHGIHSPLMLCLCGKKQNTGKTEYFRRLLPPALSDYYAESKLDAGKDDEILMTQKLLILDDEMGGKSKRDSDRLKELCSKQTFSLREPYGRSNVDLLRIGVLAGATNREGILNDHTGNRRMIPIHVTHIDHKAYNAIDKTALLMEAYHLWKDGFQWKTSQNDIELLSSKTQNFEATSSEEEMFFKYFRLPFDDDPTRNFTTTEIKNIIEQRSAQKLGLRNLGQVLSKHLRKQNFINDSGVKTKGWKLILKDSIGDGNGTFLRDAENVSKSVSKTDHDDKSIIAETTKNDEDEEFTLF